MLARQYMYEPVNFPTELLLRDLRLVSSLAEQQGVGTGLVDAIADTAQQAVDRGMGRQDFLAMYDIVSS